MFLKALMAFARYSMQAEFIAPPERYFSYLHDQGIGAKTSHLYVAWAQHLINEGDVQAAGGVLQKGLHNQAQPREKLEQLYW